MGYLSSAEFMSEKNIITGSGDSTCKYWSVETGKPIAQFRDHSADVMSVSGSKLDMNIFASGSVDSTCKVLSALFCTSILILCY